MEKWSLLVLWATFCLNLSSGIEDFCPKGFVMIRPKPSIFTEQSTNPLPKPKCYKFITDKTTFKNAESTCKELRAELATPKEREAAAGIVDYVITNEIEPRKYWIGLSDRDNEGFLTWIDEEPLDSNGYSPWLAREPESSEGAEPGSKGARDDCVEMMLQLQGTTYSARWFDTICSRKEAFICEMDTLIPVGPILPTTTAAPQGLQPRKDLGTLIKIHEPEPNQFTTGSEVKKTTTSPTQSAEMTTAPEDISRSGFPLQVVEYVGDANSTNATQSGNEDSGSVPSGRKSCKLECTPNVMRAVCPIAFFPLINETTAVLNNRSCVTRRNRTHLIAHTTLDGCGTIASNLRGDQVSFRNTIRLLAKGKTIIRNERLLSGTTDFMILDCRFRQRHQLQQNFKPKGNQPKVEFSLGKGGSLPHAFLLYKTQVFDCPYGKTDYPVRISISNRLYFEVRLRIPSKQVELHPVACRATPDTNYLSKDSYKMMEDGCILDSTFRIEKSEEAKVSRFSVQAFTFAGYFREIFVYCELIVCKLGSESSPSCPYACSKDKKSKKKRDLDNTQTQSPANASVIQAHLGPITFVPDDPDPSTTGNIATAVTSRQTSVTSSAQHTTEHKLDSTTTSQHVDTTKAEGAASDASSQIPDVTSQSSSVTSASNDVTTKSRSDVTSKPEDATAIGQVTQRNPANFKAKAPAEINQAKFGGGDGGTENLSSLPLLWMLCVAIAASVLC